MISSTKSRQSSPPRAQDRATASDRVADALRDAIIRLELKPGSMLDKTALTHRFGVSRFPVSEAFKRLQGEGLVDIRPQSGSRVSLIRLADVHENLFLRRALEAEVAAYLCGVERPGLIEDLRRNMRYQKAAVEASDRPGFHDLDVAFHDLLFDAVRYPRVKVAVETARSALDRVRRLLSTPRRHAVTYDEHLRIVEALERRDAAAARATMVAHIDAVFAELEAFSASHPEVFSDAAAARELHEPA